MGELAAMTKHVLMWTNDADSAYLGARVCKAQGLVGPFHTLAHAAIERYLKGILHADDPGRYTSDELRKNFGHNLGKLLAKATGTHPVLANPEAREYCDALTSEFELGRYLITADVSQLSTGDHIEALLKLGDAEEFDNLICLLRNIIVSSLTEGERDQSLLSAIRRARLSQWREPLELQNTAMPHFKGIAGNQGSM